MTVLNLVTSIAQIASPILYAVFIVVIYFQFRSARESVREVRQEFLAGGRPTVAVHDEYDATTGAINLVVENVGQGPAKDINFEFARPVECSDGVVISDLPLYTMGLASLSPAARITCYWDDFGDLMDHLQARRLEGAGFAVTVRYSDLTGAIYSNEWDIQPIIYQGLRHHPAQHASAPAGDGRRDGAQVHDIEPSATGATTTGPSAAALAGPARADGSTPATSSS